MNIATKPYCNQELEHCIELQCVCSHSTGCYKVYYFCVEFCVIMYFVCCRCQTLLTVNMENWVQIVMLLQKAVGGCRWFFVCVSFLSSSFKLHIRVWYDKQDRRSSLCIFYLIHAICVLGVGRRQPAKYPARLPRSTLTLTYVWDSRSLR